MAQEIVGRVEHEDPPSETLTPISKDVMTDRDPFAGTFRICDTKSAPISTLEEWRERGAPAGGARQWAPGRSAMEEARAWLSLGPLLRLLDSHALTRGFRPTMVTPEVRLPLDEHAGNTRNTDVLVHGRAGDQNALAAIEAKADEPFDHRSVAAAAEDPGLSPRSNLPTRIDRLCEVLFGEPLTNSEAARSRFGDVKYQLVHGPVAAVLAAQGTDASIAVFAVHEFRTDATQDSNHDRNAADWALLWAAIGQPEPEAGVLGEIPVSEYPEVTLLAGKAISDLRTSGRR